MDSYHERQVRRNKELDEKLTKDENAFWEKLHAKLTERGHTFEIDPEKKHIIRKIDGVRYIGMGLKRERPNHYGSSWSGKLRFTIGDYGNKRQFFQSQARGGDFDYDAIADEVRDVIARTKHDAEIRRQRQASEKEAWALRDTLIREFFATFTEEPAFEGDDDEKTTHLHPPKDVDVTLKASHEGLSLNFDRPLTEAELREVLAGCKKAGLI